MNRTEMAQFYRLEARRIAQAALNVARREIRDQVVSGHVNLPAIQGIGGQDGFNPTKIDTSMDSYISHEVAKLDRKIVYWSEENKRNYTPENGTIHAWCDPLDGTTNSFTLFGGYAVVLFFDRVQNGRMDNLGGAIASFDGTVVSWEHTHRHGKPGNGQVFIDWPADFTWPSTPHEPLPTTAPEPPYSTKVEKDALPDEPGLVPIYQGVAKRFAAVSTTAERVKDLRALVDFDYEPEGAEKEDRIYLANLAGNPITAPLLTGQLGGVIEPHRVKLHDAAYLLPLWIAGGETEDIYTGNELYLPDFFGEPDADRRLIGPFFATSGFGSLDELEMRRKRVTSGLAKRKNAPEAGPSAEEATIQSG